MLTAAEIRESAIAHGRQIKRVNAFTALLCGGLPAVLLGIFFPASLAKWIVGLVVGFLWASWFEYAYHRFLLHLPGTFFAKEHLRHHASVDTPQEAEHLNLGRSPLWVFILFLINSIPVLLAEALFGARVASGILAAFALYFIITEEFHWRIHLGEWLPPGFGRARAHHLAHHMYPNARFSIFLPFWDILLRSASSK